MIERAGEKEDLEKVIEAGFGDVDDYVSEARRFIKKYLPEKVIRRYLAPDRVYTKEDYIEALGVMIHNYKWVRILRREVQMSISSGKEPNPSTLEEIRRGEELGF